MTQGEESVPPQGSVSNFEDLRILPTGEVDVLIIGAGPAGLMLANWFNHSQVKFRILEKKTTVVTAGQADGLKCLTIEMLHSIGIGDQIQSLACRINEEACWDPDENGRIRRSTVIPNIVPGMKEIREVTLNQGTIEHLLLDNVYKARNVKIEYSKVPLKITEHDNDAYPLHVLVQNIGKGGDSQQNGRVQEDSDKEIVRAKFVVGCDGAHSWIRKHFGIPMRGEQTDSIWGVMDIVPKTNFPDIRKNSMIESTRGNLLLLPRENKLVRFYVPLSNDKLKQDSISEGKTNSVKTILELAGAILSPYTLESNYCEWWSTYRIGQRLADNFSLRNRLFLAGDAAHTHSPKVGQGMNMSMQDAYNLGWKLLACLQWNADPSLLSTYESERRPVAQDLLDFDRKYTQAWAKSDPNTNKVSHLNGSTELLNTLTKNMVFTTGLLIHYPSSPIVKDKENTTCIAKNLIPGMRVPDFQVVNQSDGNPTNLKKILQADGRFRVIVFAGDISSSAQLARLQKLGESLSAEASFLHTFTPPEARIDSLIEVLTIHSAKRVGVELLDLHEIFHPWSDQDGWDYWKVYADDADVLGVSSNAYATCGIETNGLLAVVRPDGYVGLLCEWEDLAPVEAYFAGILPAFSVTK